jgi:hypothetical protein
MHATSDFALLRLSSVPDSGVFPTWRVPYPEILRPKIKYDGGGSLDAPDPSATIESPTSLTKRLPLHVERYTRRFSGDRVVNPLRDGDHASGCIGALENTLQFLGNEGSVD